MSVSGKGRYQRPSQRFVKLSYGNWVLAAFHRRAAFVEKFAAMNGVDRIVGRERDGTSQGKKKHCGNAESDF